ncbi:MAG TPA: CAP domain-containing protein [Anaerolineales bacterium]|nr:CAP domain-containing protein [Anaerolineales bacterium]
MVLGAVALIGWTQPVLAQEAPTNGDFPAAQSFRLYISMAANKAAASAPPVQSQSELDQVLALTNAERAKVGCPALTINNTLGIVAQAHARDMGDNDFFSHDSLNGDSPFDRMTAAGYRFSSAAENIAAGYGTPASVVAGWMGSSGHRANILNCNLTEIGIGYYKMTSDTGDVNYYHYWVQDFGRP